MPVLPLASVVETLANAVAPWNQLYSDSKLVSITVTFVHIASLLAGGGLALSADRATFRVTRGTPQDRERHLAELGLTHRPVVIALGISTLSGVLLFFSDVDTLATSIPFWIKMALVAILLGNGLRMTRLEGRLSNPSPEPSGVRDADGQWSGLRNSAAISIVLWFATTLLGVVLMNV